MHPPTPSHSCDAPMRDTAPLTSASCPAPVKHWRSVMQALLPAKAGDLESVKLAAPRREVIYKLDGVPILMDLSGKYDLMPTTFGLWRVGVEPSTSKTLHERPPHTDTAAAALVPPREWECTPPSHTPHHPSPTLHCPSLPATPMLACLHAGARHAAPPVPQAPRGVHVRGEWGGRHAARE